MSLPKVSDILEVVWSYTLPVDLYGVISGNAQKLSNNNSIAAFVMESGAQMAGGVIIYPKNFQRKINKICKDNDVLFILDEIATGFGRLGSMIEYENQHCKPDIVSFGKMLTGGYLTFAATLTTDKIYNAFLDNFHQL